MDTEGFITRWAPSGGSERANYQLFASDLAELLGVPKPDPAQAKTKNNKYCFEHPVKFIHTGTQSNGLIDLYRAGHFVMEAKQGTDAKPAEDDAQPSLLPDLPSTTRKGHGTRGTKRWDDTMLRARNQADGYARAVSREDGWPPFLLIVDVGHVIEVYADFSGQGQGYTQFPDGNRYRITLEDLRDEKIRERLRLIWTDPLSLDPARVSAQVTRKVADRLAALGKSFEGQGHAPETVATFLMRCLFTMFAEDVELLPKGSFSAKLVELRGHPHHAQPTLQSLWQTMNTGGFSTVLTADLKHFNGGLFKDATALPLDSVQLSLLIDAASYDWREVEPAIFGTLLERALSVRDRHKLGAHYTPRAYVERLVVPTIIDPLRADWQNVQATAATYAKLGQDDAARDTVRAFHRHLCEIRVLDPACGSGNFLYVALELMKRLEGEVTALLADLGEDQTALGLAGHTVDPHQFLGIELNPWAAAVAELVLWIGYLQWHFRTYGQASPAEPVLRDFKNIENRDAVLTYSGTRPRMDDAGKPVTRWDGQTTIVHPVTGEAVPDPAARVQVQDYIKPKPAMWPDADFIVGNPPFIGASRLRDALGDGYAQALWAAYPKMPQSADFVMFWWEKAALAARGYKPATDKSRAKGTRRFGLITTNSLRQTFNRKVTEAHLNDTKTPLTLTFAIPDHPWVDSADAAAVRIAMTVAEAGKGAGRLGTVVGEEKNADVNEGRPVNFALEKGKIFANLRIGADIAQTKPLRANSKISTRGVMLFGSGFIVTEKFAKLLLPDFASKSRRIRPYCHGRDLLTVSRGAYVIDLWGLDEFAVRQDFPKIYQHVLDTVYPERQHNNRESRKRNWWIFGEPLGPFRPALETLTRYIVTAETMKHRMFQFLDGDFLPDNALIAIALDDACDLAILSSKQHVTWALTQGAILGPTPRYNKSRCFDPFPFPDPTEAQKTQLRSLGEQLDAHRKAQQAAHPKLTLTAMYNVLEKLRAGQRIEGKDKEIYDQGLIGILRDIHDQIDTAVADAYGWPATLTDDEILHRLVDLNRERAAEEAAGKIRWLRPEYQNPAGHAAAGKTAALDLGGEVATAKPAWPKTLPEQIAAVRSALHDLGTATPDQVARQFTRARAGSVQPLLESLAALGQARLTQDGRYAGQ